ncbi:poly(ADP-ribose) glycohydrolase-like isoform X1 [Asterias rubens]|uniref:poly(ADP-ribose) glycohydrolase-like isoform X1 n=1 Tax=Asterias rubens TaxID=7604 RepID=UPI0014553124|nr:poly(ADP-ribose) glycohydrolase-like isoform X1 [Asterias rubens]XP_033644446.1 poly(ADP-ribose) glycohydrolase-like isoform X1 [Asterias rubens]XP_033644447.1 poly(ADP-ribose) glycohydrolase-like isoform X1 [Asterias rubens]
MSHQSEEESGKKRLRQTSLEDCFSSVIKRQRRLQEAEESILDDIETSEMNVKPSEVFSEKQRMMREQMAAAAERRRESQSPYSTPPHDEPPSPESDPNIDAKLNESCPTTSHNQPKPKGSDGLNVDKPSTSTTGNKLKDTANSSSSYRKSTGNGSRNFESVFSYLEDSDNDDIGGSSSYPSNRTRSGAKDSIPSPASVRDSPKKPSPRKVNLSPVSKNTLQKKPKIVDSKDEEDSIEDEKDDGNISPTLEYNSSMPLFTDSEPQSSQDVDVSTNKDAERIVWRGVNISEMNRAPDCRTPLPQLKPNNEHTVLFRPYIRTGTPPRPYPDGYRDTWDTNHVRMPCSLENLYPVDGKNGEKTVQSRWELIEQTLLCPITNSLELEEAILTYNARYCTKWNFSGLHHFFTEAVDLNETQHFFSYLLPKIVKLALMLPKICTQAIPLLRQQQTHTITLTQLQLASLLANAFFCTFPRRNAQQKKSEYSRFPDINFNRLFEGSQRKSLGVNQRKAEKLRCIINYFRRIDLQVPAGTVSFTRKALDTMPRWEKSSNTLTKVHGNVTGMIEDEGEGMLQMDFANMYIGGGALGNGLVQEEIRFMICPELIVSRLFTEVLDPNECLVIKGVERFNDYTGYANTFQWTGDFQDNIPRDSWGRKETEIVALDALVFRNFSDQFKPQLLRRELNKAFCGFYENGTPVANLTAIATGNWGCGAFGGDARLKGLLQMMAAAECHRDVAYFTFGDAKLCFELCKMNEFLVSQGVTVGDLWLVLQRYREEVLSKTKRNFANLYTFIYQVYNDFESSTDNEEDEEEEKEAGKGVDGEDAASASPDYRIDTP